MRLGAVLPQTEIASDPSELRTWAEGVASLGFRHVLSIDHVLGADASAYPDRTFHYTSEDAVMEPLVLFGFLAACAPGLELVTAIMILPQRPTALVAAQTALVDVLTGGRTRLGVGLGWNDVEFEALGMSFSDRGRRVEEQVSLLRRLWQEPTITFEGEHHTVRAAGLNPRPVQRPVPIWFGGIAEPALRRAARLGDGYLPPFPLPRRPLASNWPARLERVREWRQEAGRGDAPWGLEPRLDGNWRSAEDWRAAAEEWASLGATHLSVQTTGGGLYGAEAHLERLAEVRQALEGLVE